MTTITKEQALANAINAYTVDMATEWQTPIRNAMELENILDSVYTYETYAEPSADFTNVIQAYQGAFVSTGNIKAGSKKATLQTLMSNLQFNEEQLKQFGSSQFPLYKPEGYRQVADHPFIQMMLNEMYFEAWKEEMGLVEIKGVRVEPTAGQPGTVLGSVDGFEKVFADEIAAGNLNTMTTGTILENNISSKVLMCLDGMPLKQRNAGGVIYMSPRDTTWYSRDYKRLHSHADIVRSDAAGKILLVDDYPKWIIRELTEKPEGTFWFDVRHRNKTNMIIGKHKVFSDMPTLEAYPEPKGLKLTSSWHRFYSIRRYEHTFVTKVA